jgi:hypothetical protein
MRFKPILLPVDFLDFSLSAYEYARNSERALQYAISLAGYGAELTMCRVVEGAPDLTAAQVINAARTERLDKLISDNQRKHLNVRTAVRCS